MQSTHRLVAAARRGLLRSSCAGPSALFPKPVCLRCGSSIDATSSRSGHTRPFARQATPTTATKSSTQAPRRATSPSNRRLADKRKAGDAVGVEGIGSASKESLAQLLDQLPAADVPAAIAALRQRLAAQVSQSSGRSTGVAAVQAEAEDEEIDDDEGQEGEDEDEDEEEFEEDENEGEYAVLRERLAAEGVVRTEAGEELTSMEELEKQLKEESGTMDDQGELVLAEQEGEEDDEELDEEDEEAEQASERADKSLTSSPRRKASSTSAPNTFWIQERRDGTVAVTEWPFADDDDADDLSSSYDVNMPQSSEQKTGVVGQAIGGEKMSRADVLEMREKDLQEHFTKGSGKGGQKVNKSSNCVHLHHLPTGTIVKCHATRSLAENRQIARNIMKDRLEELMLGPASKNGKRTAKIRKQKAKTRKRAAIKYGEAGDADEDEVDVTATEVVGAQRQRSDSKQ